MSTIPRGKPAARVALERPYAKDNERSQERALSRGVMPKTLDALIAWLMDCEANEVPTELHKHEVWRDHGQHAEGGSHLGSPAWADPMRRLMEGSPSMIDADGYFLTPLRAALSRMRRRWSVPAAHVEELIRVEGAWRVWADKNNMHPEVATMFLGAALRELWREHADRGLRLV